MQDLDDQIDVIPIPVNIKPKLIKYRIEILYWGYRRLKKVNLLPITRPNIILNCLSTTLRSDAMHQKQKDLDHRRPTDYMDLVKANWKHVAKIIN